MPRPDIIIYDVSYIRVLAVQNKKSVNKDREKAKTSCWTLKV